MSLVDEMLGRRGDDEDVWKGTTATAIDEDRVVGGHGAGVSRLCCGRGALFGVGRVCG
jgi:hypothetical protein